MQEEKRRESHPTESSAAQEQVQTKQSRSTSISVPSKAVKMPAEPALQNRQQEYWADNSASGILRTQHSDRNLKEAAEGPFQAQAPGFSHNAC